MQLRTRVQLLANLVETLSFSEGDETTNKQKVKVTCYQASIIISLVMLMYVSVHA